MRLPFVKDQRRASLAVAAVPGERQNLIIAEIALHWRLSHHYGLEQYEISSDWDFEASLLL